jgi:hypothetical protein
MKIGLFGPCYQILAAALEALLSIRTQNASYRYGFKSVPWFSDGRFFFFKNLGFYKKCFMNTTTKK